MLKKLIFLTSAIAVTACKTVPQTVQDRNGNELKLVWQEEFSQDGVLDSSKWTKCERKKSDWNNYMSKKDELYVVKDGNLHLRGIINPDQKADPVPFLTGGVISKGKFNFKYGKIQIRAKFDSAQGCWPALWMLGEEGKWPTNGEIDLMEHLNFDDKVYQTVHSYYTLKVKDDNKPQKSITAPIDRKGYNTYGMEWDENSITFTVNNKPTLTYKRDSTKGPEQFPFEQDFYILMSMQIEGNWVGKADPTHYPTEMLIDWVRVYQ
jgi:beta-glucanase (GH16 family)